MTIFLNFKVLLCINFNSDLTMANLTPILWDQLSLSISSLRNFDKDNDYVLMCESYYEATFVKHHKKKLVLLFSAMRHFKNELIEQGYKVLYFEIFKSGTKNNIVDQINETLKQYSFEKTILTSPSEYHILESLQGINGDIEILEDDRFLAPKQFFTNWAKDKKSLQMESFYREMRIKYNILLSEKKPLGGKWNYDSENRKFPKVKLSVPPTFFLEPDKITIEVIDLVSKKFPEHFGDIEAFHFAVTRKDALKALDMFINERLEKFGDYQDAMIQNEPWMFHSHISFYLNIGLLLPLECIKKVEDAYRSKSISLSAVEGFIRQILGWREYIRGVYWLKMPEYKTLNFLNASKKLPDFYWSGKTKMNCVSQCVKETKENAYAHHIQRLMVLGNFALLAGIDPKEINEWYWIVYADAYEWVELPNVSGMILYSDGGLLGSKPYAASGAYINKMSNYCGNCSYNVDQKNGNTACPFNYLYWNFLLSNKAKLEKNYRLSIAYKTLSNMEPNKLANIKKDAADFLKTI